ncbi:MAG TPA: 16S rRNA (guanine(527)-N(7))-methyltransferase RsmG [Aggregatilineales bacterium]|nr:16S rRNA (guanine(527)-N(7))-methyltransferase RsmG [Aggregatilineales bacterium]
MSLIELPQEASRLLKLDLNEEQQRAFERYSQALISWNERVNLTAIVEPLAIEIRHFLDSLSILKVAALPNNMRVIDVGAGAGFPGLPLKIVCPQINLTLLEATGKKTAFMQYVVDDLALTGVKIANVRAEDAGQDPAFRENYDLVLARSVAHMPVLVEYLLPLCKVGGRCIAMKGESAAAEIALAEIALRLLGGHFLQLVPVELPHVAETHYLVIIEKIAATPRQFPRKPGVPTKKPL